MARNRMIKPDFWSSSTLNSVSRDARLTFIGVWNFCDDYGFCLRSSRALLGDIYPYDKTVTEAKLNTWINELIEVKLLIPVDYSKKSLLFVKGWGEHQKVVNKSKRSFIHTDDLEEVIKDYLESHETLIRNYLESHSPKKKEKEKEKEESNKAFKPPAPKEFYEYCKNEGYAHVAENAFKGYEAGNWHDAHGNKIKNWKQKLQNGWFKNSEKQINTSGLSARP